MAAIPHCPFCRENGLLKGQVIAESSGGYMMENVTSPGDYLIIPSVHAEQPNELPDTWWQDFKTLLAQIPTQPQHYNISLNLGQPAGQSVKHLHFWIIPRTPDHRHAGKGLRGLLSS
jgi:diadenosine tetraphosphate (Ap4A) HIT family hydrolase